LCHFFKILPSKYQSTYHIIIFPPPPSVQECLTCKKVKFDGTYVQTVIENILTDLNKSNYRIDNSFVEYINTLLKKYVVITPKMIYNIVSTSLVVDKDQVLSVSDINLDYVTLPDEKELKLILTKVLTTIKPDPSLDNIYKLELPRILVEDLKRLYDILVYGFKVSEKKTLLSTCFPPHTRRVGSSPSRWFIVPTIDSGDISHLVGSRVKQRSISI